MLFTTRKQASVFRDDLARALIARKYIDSSGKKDALIAALMGRLCFTVVILSLHAYRGAIGGAGLTGDIKLGPDEILNLATYIDKYNHSKAKVAAEHGAEDIAEIYNVAGASMVMTLELCIAGLTKLDRGLYDLLDQDSEKVSDAFSIAMLMYAVTGGAQHNPQALVSAAMVEKLEAGGHNVH